MAEKKEILHIKEGKPDAPCDIHDWPTDGIALRLVKAMRDRHETGGVNACRECLDRAFQDRDAMQARDTK